MSTLASFTSATATGMHLDEDRGVVWVGHDTGELSTVDLATGSITTHQTLELGLTDLTGAADRLLLADAVGGIWHVDPDAPTDPATLLLDLGTAPQQLAVTPAGETLLATIVRDGLRRLVRVGLANGSMSSGSRTEGVSGVHVSGPSAVIGTVDRVTGGGRLQRLVGADALPMSGLLPPVGRIGSVPAGTWLCTVPRSSSLVAVEPAAGTTSIGTPAGVGEPLVEAQGRTDASLVILTASAVSVLGSVQDLAPEPQVFPPGEPMFVGSWIRLQYDTADTGLGPADVDFVVPDGPDAGLVSHAQENGATEPTPILVAGGRPGGYRVQMLERVSGAVLAEAEYEVTAEWTDPDRGPSLFLTGDTFVGAGDSGWGGGPNAPQNLGDLVHTGTWQVLLLLVDTSTDRWPVVDLAQVRTDVLDHVTDGFTVAGTARSVREYFEENSNTLLTIGVHSTQVFGPVSLPNAWTDYFAQTVDSAGTVTDARWAPKGSTVQSVITRAVTDGVVTTGDLRAADALVIVPRSPDANPTAGNRFAWPYASIGKQARLLGTNVMTDNGSIAHVFVPLDFAVHDGRQMHSTLSHETGHNLGLLDVYDIPEYSDPVTARITGGWEMMAGSRDLLPHFSIANKMRMGWVAAGHLTLFNFAGAGAVNQTITLHASELGPPPAGRVRGIEIRLGDGWNYYVEYRATQPGDISDAVVPDRRVMLTDVTSESFTAPLSRPRVLFVPGDVDGDGWLITTPADFEATDPGTLMDLRVGVVSTAADNAVVRVQYGSNGRPEPGIRPWTGGPSWQSPDIEVRNAKSAANPALANTPWLGHDNTVIAKVRNNGDLPATGVIVDFFVIEYTAGDGPMVPLGSDTRNVAVGATVEFSVPWVPPAINGRHYCIVVRIRLYQDPGNPAVVDHNIFNNEARSNYSSFISASASPSTRVGSQVQLANPFGTKTIVSAEVSQTNPVHRAFVEHAWLRLAGQESRPILVLDEALYGSREWNLLDGMIGGSEDRWLELLWRQPNQVSVRGEARHPVPLDCTGIVPTGGAGLQVSAGRATRTEIRDTGRALVMGNVSFIDDGSDVPSGTVLVEVSDGTRAFTQEGPVSNGSFNEEFRNPFGPGTAWVQVHFVGAFAAAASESDRRVL